MTEKTQVVPQQLYAVTFAATDIGRLRSFYEGWGWEALPYSNDEYVAFKCGESVVGFFRKDLLAAEAAPGNSAPSGWRGVTLAVGVPTREEVDAHWQAAVSAGATAVAEPADRAWGGRSGYVADPEGNPWEIAWVPETAGQA